MILRSMKVRPFFLFCLILLSAGFASADDSVANGALADSFFKTTDLSAYQLEENNYKDQNLQTDWYASRDTSLGSFPKEFGRNFANLFSTGNLMPLVVGASATGVAYGLDDNVHHYFDGRERLEDAAEAGSFMGSPAVIVGGSAGLLLVGQFSSNAKFRGLTYDLAQGIALGGILTQGIKYAVGRVRPDGSNDASFVSGHTSSAFTVATILSRYYGPKVGIPAYFAAAFVGSARIEQNKHFLSDVVAGAALGYIVGKTVTRDLRKEPPRFMWSPMVSPKQKAIGLNMMFSF